MANDMRRKLAAVLLVMATASAGAAAAAEDAEAGAVEASSAWLGLVDGGRYAESWAEAAELFRGAVPKSQWVRQVGGVRAPLGKVIERKLRSRSYQTSLPGAPDGEYVVLQYETSFANKKTAIETVTPMREKDGRWRVSGYYIR
jgi:opacity protein-like surface antigen